MNDQATIDSVKSTKSKKAYATTMLLVGDKYKITRDKYQYIVNEKCITTGLDKNGKASDTPAGTVYWMLVGYFPNLEQVYMRLLTMDQPEGHLGDVAMIIDSMETLHNEFVIALDKIGLK